MNIKKKLSDSDHLKVLKDIPQHEQRSFLWFEQRKDKLTSSDAATALGINPYQKPIELLFKKCGHGKPFTGNVATLHGQKYEDEAIGHYCRAMGKRNYDFGLLDFDAVYRPDDVQTLLNYPQGIPWMAGSTDGVAEDVAGRENLILLEVKCPFRRKIKYGECPRYYYPQVQLNMAILNLEKADYIEYKPASGGVDMILNIVRIQRDRGWFDKNVIVLDKFWNDVLKWRGGDITQHPEYAEYHKKTLEINSPPPPRPMMFVDDSESED